MSNPEQQIVENSMIILLFIELTLLLCVPHPSIAVVMGNLRLCKQDV